MNRLLAFILPALLLFTGCDEPEPEPEERFFTFPVVVEQAFNPAQLDTPESIAADWDGNLYVNSALNGLVYKRDADDNWSVLTALPIGTPLVPCGDFPGILGGVTVDWDGSLYINAASCEPEHRGVWKVDSDTGASELIAPFGFDVLPNGIARFADRLFMADSLGAVWTVPMDGGEPELWIDGPLFEQSGVMIEGVKVPGPNGIQFYGTHAFVSNSSQKTLIRIPVEDDLSAGEPEVYHVLSGDEEVGCDDFAFDVFGRIYCTTDPSQLVIRIDPDGSEHVVMDASDPIDGPTAVTFGRGFDHFTLYVASAAFPFFPAHATGNGPSVVRTTRFPGGGYPLR